MFKKITLVFLLMSFVFYGQTKSQDVDSFTKELDQKIPKLLQDFMVPGTAIAIIENGELVLQKAYGYSDLVKGEKVTTKTGFNIGSISKTIAAWGIMKLVEEDKIDLDAPAENYLTRWELPESDFDSKKVTIRRLLSHTAGLSLHGYPGWTPKDRLSTIEESLNGRNNGPGRVEMIMEPGTKWKYSGGGYTILQLIIEEVTGQKFEDYIQTAVLNPIGMKNSSYKIDETILKNSSLEHDGFGEQIDFELFTAQAAAGLHTTIEDFTRFAYASLFAHKDNKTYNKVLKESTVKKMMKPAAASNDSYGLGYQMHTIHNTSYSLKGHGGANSGWHAFFRVNPDTNDGFIMITNGGAGQNIYTQVFCDWIQWKTGESMGNRCEVKPSVAVKLKTIIDSEGIINIVSAYEELKVNKPEDYSFSESILNNFGYYYMRRKEIAKAEAVFKLNVDQFPKSSNVYDSYAEALLENSKKEQAIINYKKSVVLNPANTNAINILKSLNVDVDGLPKTFEIDAEKLNDYLGKYQLAPEFIVTILLKENKLIAQPTGQTPVTIIPMSEDRFFVEEVKAKVTFNRDANGVIESMTLHQNGRDTVGHKLKE
ncbi:serine hydrolase [Winogradskyella sp. PG-2]|uniref:serine hydrolase n=1 Tax=Winogradskyella sp. PG-2 TaxID=754409 RepID=UPI0004588A16|nr:serine hydrolase [Winogradskyella sp. PG-2]BAO77666.1 D-alanyl-D-alanine carboxypeptidase [Winogradskyella sp. PG-2]